MPDTPGSESARRGRISDATSGKLTRSGDSDLSGWRSAEAVQGSGQADGFPRLAAGRTPVSVEAPRVCEVLVRPARCDCGTGEDLGLCRFQTLGAGIMRGAIVITVTLSPIRTVACSGAIEHPMPKIPLPSTMLRNGGRTDGALVHQR